MALFKKKEKKAEPAAPKAAAKVASQKPAKQAKPVVPPDVYTLLLGLAALFLIASTVVLGLNFYWYQTTEPAVVPMSWAR